MADSQSIHVCVCIPSDSSSSNATNAHHLAIWNRVVQVHQGLAGLASACWRRPSFSAMGRPVCTNAWNQFTLPRCFLRWLIPSRSVCVFVLLLTLPCWLIPNSSFFFDDQFLIKPTCTLAIDWPFLGVHVLSWLTLVRWSNSWLVGSWASRKGCQESRCTKPPRQTCVKSPVHTIFQTWCPNDPSSCMLKPASSLSPLDIANRRLRAGPCVLKPHRHRPCLALWVEDFGSLPGLSRRQARLF